MPCPNLAKVGCYGSVIVLYRIVFATSILWNLYALELLCFASSLLPAPSHCEFVTFVSKVRVPIKYLSAEASIMYATITQKSHAVLTIFTCTLQRGWVRSPGHVGTHCTHLCPWNQPWTAAVGYGGPFCCTLEASCQWTLCLEVWAPHSQLQWQENITDGLTLLPAHICNLESPCTLIRMNNTHS